MSLFVIVYVRFAPIANKDIKFVYRSLQNVTKVQILIVQKNLSETLFL